MPNGAKAVCATATLSNPVQSDTRGKFTLGPGGAAEHSPGRQPWETGSNGSPKAPSGATEPQALNASVVPPGLNHRKLPPETQGSRPGLLSGAPCGGFRGTDSRHSVRRIPGSTRAAGGTGGLPASVLDFGRCVGAMLTALREHAPSGKTCPRRAVGMAPITVLLSLSALLSAS
jgi:hypothetical protein